MRTRRVSESARDEKTTIRGRQRHEITLAYRLLVVQTWHAWQLHDPKRENSRAKLQNVATDSTAAVLADSTEPRQDVQSLAPDVLEVLALELGALIDD